MNKAFILSSILLLLLGCLVTAQPLNISSMFGSVVINDGVVIDKITMLNESKLNITAAGTNCTYINFTASNDLLLYGSFTYYADFQKDGPLTTNEGRLLNIYKAGSSSSGLYLGLVNSGNVRFFKANATNSTNQVPAGVLMSNNTRYRLFVTENDDTLDVTVYVNGELKNSSSYMNITGMSLDGGGFIGSRQGIDSCFNGTFYNVKIWNRSLSADAIAKLDNESQMKTDIRIPVLVYHNVGDPWGYDNIDNATFNTQMKYLNDSGFSTITTKEYINWTQRGGFIMPKRPIMITFDTPTYQLIQNVSTITDRYHYKVIAAIVTDWVGKNVSQVSQINENSSPLLTWSNYQTLVGKGWEISSHSMTHPDLTLANQSEIIRQLNGSKQAVWNNISYNVTSFIMPYYEYNTSIVADAYTFYNFVMTNNTAISVDPFYLYTYSNITPGVLRTRIHSAVTDYLFRKGVNPMEGLIVDLRFNSTGTDILDQSGHNNNGQLIYSRYSRTMINNTLQPVNVLDFWLNYLFRTYQVISLNLNLTFPYNDMVYPNGSLIGYNQPSFQLNLSSQNNSMIGDYVCNKFTSAGRYSCDLTSCNLKPLSNCSIILPRTS